MDNGLLNWKLKSLIQRACSTLPAGQEQVYYFLQKHFGSLRRPPDPMPNLRDAVKIVTELKDLGFSLEGKRVMEVGTGLRLDMPTAFYLLGAEAVDTFDLHRYLRPELVMRTVEAMLRHQDEILERFSGVTNPDGLGERLRRLQSVKTIEDLRKCANITYHAPANAASTGLPDHSVDLQFSYTVFEHIPGDILRRILLECTRVLKSDGLACHHIDPSDHFAHDDPSISLINFRRFYQQEWDKYNGNQFAYHNRLTVTDYEKIYADVNHEIVQWKTWRDERSLRELAAGFPLAAEFQQIPADVLATVVVRATTRPRA